MKRKNLDIDAMSQQTGVPVLVIKAALKIPLNGECKATTIKKAIKAFEDADLGSEEEHLSLKKWIELTVIPEQAKVAYDRVPSDSELKHFAFKKWEKLSREQIKFANTTEEIEKVYKEAPEDSPVRTSILKEWVKLEYIVEKLIMIHDIAPAISGVRQLVLKKIACIL